MADWTLAYDGSAIFILLLILVWYFNEKRIPQRSHRVFLIFTTMVFASAGLEILCSQMAGNLTDGNYNQFYFMMTIQGIAVHMVPILFFRYVMLLANIRLEKNYGILIAYGICIVSELVLLCMNPWFHWLFSYRNDIIRMEPMGAVLYFVDAIMVIASIVASLHAKRRFVFLRVEPVVITMGCSVVGCLLQMIYHLPVFNLTLATVCLTVYHYQQNSGKVTDSITGLFNRDFFGEYIQSKFDYNKEFAVIVVAMDDFKFVNKTYGVDSGDQLLHQIGAYLEQLNGYKTVFRLGSDQFCIVLDRYLHHMDKISEDVAQRFRHPWYCVDLSAIMLSASICCMECPQDAKSYGELIEVIDYSMSMAKKTCKGRVSMARDMELETIKQDKAIEKAIKSAMNRDELLVYYQPIYSMEKGCYRSAEALVRLHDNELGWISPEKFIPIAEKNGLIVEMGQKILENVCHFIHEGRLSETTVEYIEVNISPLQMLQANFADQVKMILEKYGVKPSQINMEITETATLNSVSSVRENINRLVEYGISFSLDDYGSGNANIDYINHMPFKLIKIDKYIIWDSFKNSRAGVTLEYTIGMLNALDLSIVAEGVETEEMKQQLAKFGCHYMQGWLYSKAVPEKEFLQLIQQQV
ncbi:MAG: EAL domain-containing protein [Eubacteriales bacterium]|nr:EAL domain-containing protein [Eubacteriales bacterium]